MIRSPHHCELPIYYMIPRRVAGITLSAVHHRGLAPVTGLCQLLLVVRLAGDGGDLAKSAIAVTQNHLILWQVIHLHRWLYIILFHMT